MSVRIRLRRMGAKKRPFYRIVVTDSRRPRDGSYIESLGYYNPITDPAEIRLNEERVLFWLGNGAIPSETAKSILRRDGILKRWSEIQKRTPPAEIQAIPAEETAPEKTDEDVVEPRGDED